MLFTLFLIHTSFMQNQRVYQKKGGKMMEKSAMENIINIGIIMIEICLIRK